jgi:hypothetical protein
LKEKVKIMESENKSIKVLMSQNVDKLTVELQKRCDEMEFFKKSYEEQKLRIHEEHELISTSLYELALQFMGLKNELSTKQSPKNSDSKAIFDGEKSN